MKTSLPPPVIEPGKHYVVGKRMRWVLAVGNDHVLYSRGGDSHLECQVKTFMRWLRAKADEQKQEAM